MAAGGNSEEVEMEVVGQQGRTGLSLPLLVGQWTSSLTQAKGRVSQRNFTADAHAADHWRLSCGEILIHLCHLWM